MELIDKLLHGKIDELAIYELDDLLEEVIILYQFWASKGFKGIAANYRTLIKEIGFLIGKKKV